MAQMISNQALFEGVHMSDSFAKLDVNRDGKLTTEELPELAESCRFDCDRAERLFGDLRGKDGCVKLEDFHSAALSSASETPKSASDSPRTLSSPCSPRSAKRPRVSFD